MWQKIHGLMLNARKFRHRLWLSTTFVLFQETNKADCLLKCSMTLPWWFYISSVWRKLCLTSEQQDNKSTLTEFLGTRTAGEINITSLGPWYCQYWILSINSSPSSPMILVNCFHLIITYWRSEATDHENPPILHGMINIHNMNTTLARLYALCLWDCWSCSAGRGIMYSLPALLSLIKYSNRLSGFCLIKIHFNSRLQNVPTKKIKYFSRHLEFYF